MPIRDGQLFPMKLTPSAIPDPIPDTVEWTLFADTLKASTPRRTPLAAVVLAVGESINAVPIAPAVTPAQRANGTELAKALETTIADSATSVMAVAAWGAR